MLPFLLLVAVGQSVREGNNARALTCLLTEKDSYKPSLKLRFPVDDCNSCSADLLLCNLHHVVKAECSIKQLSERCNCYVNDKLVVVRAWTKETCTIEECWDEYVEVMLKRDADGHPVADTDLNRANHWDADCHELATLSSPPDEKEVVNELSENVKEEYEDQITELEDPELNTRLPDNSKDEIERTRKHKDVLNLERKNMNSSTGVQNQTRDVVPQKALRRVPCMPPQCVIFPGNKGSKKMWQKGVPQNCERYLLALRYNSKVHPVVTLSLRLLFRGDFNALQIWLEESKDKEEKSKGTLDIILRLEPGGFFGSLDTYIDRSNGKCCMDVPLLDLQKVNNKEQSQLTFFNLRGLTFHVNPRTGLREFTKRPQQKPALPYTAPMMGGLPNADFPEKIHAYFTIHQPTFCEAG